MKSIFAHRKASRSPGLAEEVILATSQKLKAYEIAVYVIIAYKLSRLKASNNWIIQP